MVGCPLVVHYWADLQSVHKFRCYDNIMPKAKCQRVLVLALWLVAVGGVGGRHALATAKIVCTESIDRSTMCPVS